MRNSWLDQYGIEQMIDAVRRMKKRFRGFIMIYGLTLRRDLGGGVRHDHSG